MRGALWLLSFPVLLSGRMIQGVGTGIALPLMFNIVFGTGTGRKPGIYDGSRYFNYSNGSGGWAFLWRDCCNSFWMENDICNSASHFTDPHFALECSEYVKYQKLKNPHSHCQAGSPWRSVFQELYLPRVLRLKWDGSVRQSLSFRCGHINGGIRKEYSPMKCFLI